MKYLTGNDNYSLTNTAIALGNFDGIHKGHQVLMQEILLAKAKGLASVVFTFDPHPSFVLANKEPVDLIFVREERVKRFERLGIDILIEYPFTLETAKMLPEDFIENILVNQLGAKLIVVGSDFRFGYKRQGDVNLLKKYANVYDYEVKIIEKEKYQDEIISSSHIRGLIRLGEIEQVNALLGEPFIICGNVEHGKKLGRTIGIPTANLIPKKEKLLPPNGVYVSKVRHQGVEYKGVTNVGTNPTLGHYDKVVETYIFDMNLELYGQEIEVLLLKFLRLEKKFSGLDVLVEQMQRDIESAKEYFASV
jgi:riboflavin kinase/FMN adenylyltransferase